MTSNLGADYILEAVGTTGKLDEGTKNKVMSTVKKHFRPEFLNRLDDIVIFSPLSREELGKIVRLQLQQLSTRLEEHALRLEITDEGLEVILKAAYQPIYGARPIKRFLERVIGTHISKMILKGTIPSHAVLTIDSNETHDGLEYHISK